MIGDIAQWAIVIFIVLGMVGTWIRNGRHQTARDQEIKDSLKTIVQRLDDENTGLPALNTRIHSIDINNARYTERLVTAERDIKELKRR